MSNVNKVKLLSERTSGYLSVVVIFVFVFFCLFDCLWGECHQHHQVDILFCLIVCLFVCLLLDGWGAFAERYQAYMMLLQKNYALNPWSLNTLASRNDLQPKIGLERFLPREDIVSIYCIFLCCNIYPNTAQHLHWTDTIWSQLYRIWFLKSFWYLPGLAAAEGKADNSQHRATGGHF